MPQAKKLEDIRSEAQAELGIMDVIPVAGLDQLQPLAAALLPLAAKRADEVELFPGGWVGQGGWVRGCVGGWVGWTSEGRCEQGGGQAGGQGGVVAGQGVHWLLAPAACR